MIVPDAAQSTLNGTPWTYALELHSCALDHDKYEQCKQAVVPVFVETRQCDTEDPENEEGRSGSASKVGIGVLNVFSL